MSKGPRTGKPAPSRHGKPGQAPRPAPTTGKMPSNIYRRNATPGRPASPRPGMRSEPFCYLKEECGSCKYVNEDYVDSLTKKFEHGVEVLKATGVVERSRILAPVKSPKQVEYRSLVKLAVRPAKEPSILKGGFQNRSSFQRPVDPAAPPARFQIGLFAPGSHDVVNMDDCPLHTPPLKRLIQDLRAELEASPLTPYDEATHTGTLRYIAARSAHLTGELIVTFVVQEAAKLELKRIVAQLQRRGHKINAAHMNINPERGNAIFGAETIRLAGSDRLRERLCDLDFEVGPTSFFQINPWQAINLYRRIEQIADRPSKPTVAWDLYCGTGQISLVLARLGYKVLGIEENPLAIEDARFNAKKNGLGEKATYLAARVEDSQPAIPAWAQSPELIVVNPSRRGLADATRKHMTRLLAMFPESRFLYVSCEVETLARDLKELTSTGFQVRQVEPFDMFPQTDNMEWLVVMTR